jgi:hypothetical protein
MTGDGATPQATEGNVEVGGTGSLIACVLPADEGEVKAPEAEAEAGPCCGGGAEVAVAAAAVVAAWYVASVQCGIRL